MQRLLIRAASAAALVLFALTLLIVSLAFLGGALFFWLRAQALSPEASALIVGGVGIVLALVLVLCAKFALRGRSRPASASGTSSVDAAGLLGQSLVREALTLAQAHPYRTLLISVGAGFLAGAIPELRRLPFDLFRSRR